MLEDGGGLVGGGGEEADGAEIIEQGFDGERVALTGARHLLRAGWTLRERRENVERQRETNPVGFEDAPKQVADEVGIGRDLQRRNNALLIERQVCERTGNCDGLRRIGRIRRSEFELSAVRRACGGDRQCAACALKIGNHAVGCAVGRPNIDGGHVHANGVGDFVCAWLNIGGKVEGQRVARSAQVGGSVFVQVKTNSSGSKLPNAGSHRRIGFIERAAYNDLPRIDAAPRRGISNRRRFRRYGRLRPWRCCPETARKLGSGKNDQRREPCFDSGSYFIFLIVLT